MDDHIPPPWETLTTAPRAMLFDAALVKIDLVIWEKCMGLFYLVKWMNKLCR